MILTHLVLFSFLNGAGGEVVPPAPAPEVVVAAQFVSVGTEGRSYDYKKRQPGWIPLNYGMLFAQSKPEVKETLDAILDHALKPLHTASFREADYSDLWIQVRLNEERIKAAEKAAEVIAKESKSLVLKHIKALENLLSDLKQRTLKVQEDHKQIEDVLYILEVLDDTGD